MITMSKWRKMKCKSELNSKTQQEVNQLKKVKWVVNYY
jgi:hypothetical protein